MSIDKGKLLNKIDCSKRRKKSHQFLYDISLVYFYYKGYLNYVALTLYMVKF